MQRLAAAETRWLATEPTKRAWISVDFVAAGQQAARLDGDATFAAASPLRGKTLAVKDNLATRTLPTTAGSNSLRGYVAGFDASPVNQLLNSGTVLIGKTNLDTFARGVRSVSQVRGQTAHAWDNGLSPGGSSGGSAVAVATGVADVALGSDTCGSLRYPATYNGIFSLRPTAGRISRNGLAPLAPSQDVVGPMAADVATLADALTVTAGPDLGDPLTLTAPTPLPYGDNVRSEQQLSPTEWRPMRVGVVRSLGPYGRAADGTTALVRLAGANVELVDVVLPALGYASAIAAEWNGVKDEFARIKFAQQSWLFGPVAQGSAYANTLATQRQTRQRLLDLLDRYQLDAIAYPTTTSEPAALGATQPSGNCWLAATTGLPAVALPNALWQPAGRPARPARGIDLLGRPFSEDVLLTLAARYEVSGPKFPLAP
jgi:amidase